MRVIIQFPKYFEDGNSEEALAILKAALSLTHPRNWVGRNRPSKSLAIRGEKSVSASNSDK